MSRFSPLVLAPEEKLDRNRVDVGPDMQDRVDLIINAYTSPIIGHCGADALWRRLSLRYRNFGGRSAVRDILKGHSHYQIRQPVVKKTIVKPIVGKSPGRYWQMDLTDFSGFPSGANRGSNWLLVSIDIFSKQVFTEPLRNKTAPIVLAGFQAIIGRMRGRMTTIQSDQGPEFVNVEMRRYLTSLNVRHITSLSHTPQSQGQVERFNRTLKTNIFSRMQFDGNPTQWRQYVDEVVDQYNDTIHSAHGLKPLDVYATSDPAVIAEVREKLEKIGRKKSAVAKDDIEKGDYVRVSLLAQAAQRALGSFRKSNGVEGNWSQEVYEVDTVSRKHPLSYSREYTLKDYPNRVFQRYFLLPVGIIHEARQPPAAPQPPAPPAPPAAPQPPAPPAQRQRRVGGIPARFRQGYHH
jgi:transposase InsO family protein